MTHSSPRESIFFAALEKQSDSERKAYLDQACAGNDELRAEIERMLSAQARVGNFLEHPTFAQDTSPQRQPITEGPGTVIGNYKLLQQIGEGGFGVVYMAEQERPVKRRVAIKVIKAGMDTKAVIARFEAERQALAMMDHPNIARVLDAGATDAGRPYFVMELVKGIPITEYCDQAALPTVLRLKLFMDVCRAVQHAHQKGVIHRDLKPSNIMITLRDDKPNVKVIDFGISKATDQKLTEKTLFTAYGQMIGTPAYMSPEQAVLSEFDVDTRSDIYSLGVLLYELLTGSPPFDAQTLRSAGFDEMRRIIREVEPPRPSARLSTIAGEARNLVAKSRHMDPEKLGKLVEPDLDWIVMKAIEKDRTRRYETANGLARDIEHFLADEPVSASPPSAGYKFRKFARRNKTALRVIAAVAAVLVAATVISTWQAIRATKEEGKAIAAVAEKDKALIAEAEQHRQADISRQSAQKRLGQVQKASDILASIFINLDPKEIARQQRPLQAILVDKLDRAVQQLEGESIGDPLVVAEMQLRLGGSLIGLGEPRKAVVLLEKSLATRKALLGADHHDTLTSMNHLALAYCQIERVDLSLPLLEEALKIRRALPGPADEEMLMAASNLAQIYIEAGKRELGESLLEETLKASTETLGPAHIGTLTITNNLALAYQHDGDPQRALPLFDRTFKFGKAIWGANDPQTLACQGNLAGAYRDTGQYKIAIELYEEELKCERVTLGVDHIDTLVTMNNLAGAYCSAGNLDLALPLNEETLKLLRAKAGPEHSHTIACMDNLARAYQAAGKLDLAIPLYQETLRLEKKVFLPDDFQTLETMNNLGRAYQAAKQIDLAFPLFEETLKRRRARLGPKNLSTLSTMDSLANIYWTRKQFDKSILLYEEELKSLEKQFGRDHENTLTVIAFLGQNYKDAGRFDQAVPLLEEAQRASQKFPKLRTFTPALVQCYAQQGKNEQAAALSREMLAEGVATAPGDPRLRTGELAGQGRKLLEKKDYAQAEAVLRQCLELREKAQPEEWTTFNTKSLLGAALLGQKKYSDAEPLLLGGYEGMKKVEGQIFLPARGRLVEALERLVSLYESRGGVDDADKAAQYRKLLEGRKREDGGK